MKTIFVLLALAISASAFARPRATEYNIYEQQMACDNGRTYQWHGRVMYVDGLAALNGITYEIRCAGDGSGCSLWENGFHRGNCQPTVAPPPPAPPKHWDNYVKVCDHQNRCHWESRQID